MVTFASHYFIPPFRIKNVKTHFIDYHPLLYFFNVPAVGVGSVELEDRLEVECLLQHRTYKG